MLGTEMILEILYIVLIGGGLLLGFQVNHLYFLLPIVGIAIVLIINKIKKDTEQEKAKREIKEKWGKDHKEKRNFDFIEKLYRALLKEGNCENIDDTTWRDLDMDFVYEKLDHTMSSPGQQYLYYLLRHLIHDEVELKNRSTMIEEFMKNKDYAELLQVHLKRIGKEQSVDIVRYLLEGMKIVNNPLPLYQILTLLVILSPVIIYFGHGFGVLLLIALVMINGMVYSNTKSKIFEEMMVFENISKLLRCVNEIIKEDGDNPTFDFSKLKELYDKVKNIYRNVGSIEFLEKAAAGGDSTGILSFLNMLLLIEVRSFYKSIDLMNKYKGELLDLYIELGKIDAYIALASYKDSLKYYTKPSLSKKKPYFLRALDLYHPLLSDPVPNSIEVSARGILLTGSNASGKSTFLKTIGINAIFAQTFNTVLAKEYSSSYFNVMTSIGTLDNIIGGDSYFMVEAKSLKRIIDTLNDDVTVLCILDEIFRGTNTIERISAASEVLHYMIKKNCFVVAATHDLELTSLVEDYYDNYHFEENVDDNDVKFNYLLQKGPSRSRNAIKILKLLGYPEEIYKNAMDRANEIL